MDHDIVGPGGSFPSILSFLLYFSGVSLTIDIVDLHSWISVLLDLGLWYRHGGVCYGYSALLIVHLETKGARVFMTAERIRIHCA